MLLNKIVKFIRENDYDFKLKSKSSDNIGGAAKSKIKDTEDLKNLKKVVEKWKYFTNNIKKYTRSMFMLFKGEPWEEKNVIRSSFAFMSCHRVRMFWP